MAIEADIRPVGDAAVLAVVPDEVDAPAIERVWALAAQIRSSLCAGVLDVVPAYRSVLVRFDPLVVDTPRVIAGVRGAAERARATAVRSSRRLVVRAVFGGEHGIDFERCAHELGMREARFRDAFCSAAYRVAFLGFVAGFPYLLGLPPKLHLPRLASPRPHVPAGSVAIAAGQCGIYPRRLPGGWRIIGRTAAPIFDPASEPHALFAPGDDVRFVSVERLEDARTVEIERLAV